MTRTSCPNAGEGRPIDAATATRPAIRNAHRLSLGARLLADAPGHLGRDGDPYTAKNLTIDRDQQGSRTTVPR